MKRNQFISICLIFLLVTFIGVLPSFAQEQKKEKKAKELKVVAENELAPVRALQAAKRNAGVEDPAGWLAQASP